jgi:hypothetical protein
MLSRIFVTTNVCYNLFFNWQTEKNSKKACFGAIRNVFSFSTAQADKVRGKKWVNQIRESI